MTLTANTAAPAELEPTHAQIVSATLPLIGAHIDEITTEFYRRMFAAHPALLRNLFNRGQPGRRRPAACPGGVHRHVRHSPNDWLLG